MRKKYKKYINDIYNVLSQIIILLESHYIKYRDAL